MLPVRVCTIIGAFLVHDRKLERVDAKFFENHLAVHYSEIEKKYLEVVLCMQTAKYD